ncbi:MAG: hypothetical protein P8Y47_08880, partial [Alphaproteobacteria bacterium]
KSMKCDDCTPLSELMHIRRDLWAASEIVLMEDLSFLTTEVNGAEGEGADDAQENGGAESVSVEQLRMDATAVLFKGVEDDPIDLRLGIARDEAKRFAADVDEMARKIRENDRVPSFREIMSYPIIAIRIIPRYALAFATYVVRFARYVHALAKRLRESEAYARGVYELRRARETLPGRIAEGAGKASAAARQGAAAARHGANVLHRHYTFLVAAHNIQARYERLLSSRAEVTERGRQFLTRLEAAARSERLRLNWSNVVGWLKRQIVRGLAYFIAALERLKEHVETVNADLMRKAKELVASKRLALPAPPIGRNCNETASVVFLNPVTREIATTLMARLANAQAVEQTVDAQAADAPAMAEIAAKAEAAVATGNAPESGEEMREASGAEKLAPKADKVPVNDIPDDDQDDDTSEPGPLTRRVMEVQAELAAKPHDSAVPWLRR